MKPTPTPEVKPTPEVNPTPAPNILEQQRLRLRVQSQLKMISQKRLSRELNCTDKKLKAEFIITSDEGQKPEVKYLRTTDKTSKKITVPSSVTYSGITQVILARLTGDYQFVTMHLREIRS